MKAKKCPYCSKRISYISGFSSRRKSEYICTRCGKESKVIINKMIFVGFALAVAVAAGIMLYWIKSGNISNPLGVLLVAVPLVIFMLISPVFYFLFAVYLFVSAFLLSSLSSFCGM